MKKYPDSIVIQYLSKQPQYKYLTLNECYYCGQPASVHHIMNGPSRSKSTKYGLTIGLCPYHHQYGPDAVHTNSTMMEQMKALGQQAFESVYSHDKWMQEFHKNYL